MEAVVNSHRIRSAFVKHPSTAEIVRALRLESAATRDRLRLDAFNVEFKYNAIQGQPALSYVRLDFIVVPASLRCQGLGTQAMQWFVSFLDRYMLDAALTPGHPEATSKDRLRRFYKRFGFIPNRGVDADFRIYDEMRRLPSARK